MPPKHSKGHQHGGRPHGKAPHRKVPAKTPVAPLPESLAQSILTRLSTVEVDDAELEALAGQIEAAAAGRALPALLDTLATHLEADALVVLLEGLLNEPLDPATHDRAIHLLERTREPSALEALVIQSGHGQTRAIRRAAQDALVRLRQAGITVPKLGSALVPQPDASAWPVERAWANRLDSIGSQVVGVTRRRPQGDAAFVSVVVSDDRGLVDAMGELGTSVRAVERRMQKIIGPPGARMYEVTPEYVRYRIRQGAETSMRVGREPAPDYLRWAFLLEGIDDTWEPDLEGLCRERAQSDWLDRTSVLMYALEFIDWWPDPEGRSEGGAVRRFLADVERDLDRLAGTDDPRPPPYLELLSETDYIAMLAPFNRAANAAIERQIDRHLDTILPADRRRRFYDALLQMGYLADLSKQPTLCTLEMTAAWALDPASGVAPRQHPFLREMLRKAVEVEVMGM